MPAFKSIHLVLVTCCAHTLLAGCVFSNLDNSFDPAQGGLFWADLLDATASTDAASSGDDTSLGPVVLTSTETYNTAGSFTYSVASDVRQVEIVVIGGGGGGGDNDRNGLGGPAGFGGYFGESGQTGGSSSVAIQGGATLGTATGGAGGTVSFCDGGAGGACGPGNGQGMLAAGPAAGGAGGTPDGVAGETKTSYSTSEIAAGGSLTGYTQGAGGSGVVGGHGVIGASCGICSPPAWYPGGGGGSGGLWTATRTDLAGRTLDIVVGAGGIRGASTSSGFVIGGTSQTGSDGLVELKIYK